MERELDKLTKIATVGQNKAIILKLKKQIDKLEKENERLQREVEAL